MHMRPRRTRTADQQAEALAELTAVLAHELATPVDDLVQQFVVQMLGDTRPLGVLFYGSGLRAGWVKTPFWISTLLWIARPTGPGLFSHGNATPFCRRMWNITSDV